MIDFIGHFWDNETNKIQPGNWNCGNRGFQQVLILPGASDITMEVLLNLTPWEVTERMSRYRKRTKHLLYPVIIILDWTLKFWRKKEIVSFFIFSLYSLSRTLSLPHSLYPLQSLYLSLYASIYHCQLLLSLVPNSMQVVMETQRNEQI